MVALVPIIHPTACAFVDGWIFGTSLDEPEDDSSNNLLELEHSQARDALRQPHAAGHGSTTDRSRSSVGRGAGQASMGAQTMYVLTKSAWFLLQPSSLFAGLLMIGLALASLTHRSRLGHKLAWIGLAALVGCGLLPVGSAALLPLEQRFPAPLGKLPQGPFAGIILLGGYEDGRITAARGTLTLNEAGDRLTEAAALARRLPSLPVIVSGGAGTILREEREATNEIAAFLVGMGIAHDRIVLENRSTTTYENAVFTRDIVKPQPGQPWLLVTSAAHMPRAVGSFRRQGFDVVAWPADFRTKDAGDVLRLFQSIPSGLRRLDEAAQEWLGLLAYRALGRTDALFPTP